MPTYVFKDAEGLHEELFLTPDELTTRQFVKDNEKGQFINHDGRELKRVYVPCGTPAPSVWPIRSCALGVGEDQVREATRIDREAGLNTEYASNGDAIFRDNNHRRKHLKHHGFIDKDSFI